jgi:hypothetical protein
MLKDMSNQKMPSRGSMGSSGGTNESKTQTGPGNAMLGKKQPPPKDPTYRKGSGTDMNAPPKSGEEMYEDRGMGITAHVHGSKRC